MGMFPDDPSLGGEETVEPSRHVPGGQLRGSLIVGGIEEDEVKRFGRGGGNPVFHRGFENGKVVAECLQVVAQGFGGAVMVLDEEGGLGAAAEGLDAIGAGAGKEIEDAGVRHPVAQGGEDGRADPILGGTQARDDGHFEVAAAVDAAGDAQMAQPAPAGVTRAFSFGMTWRCRSHPAALGVSS